ncbi:MAG: pyridoxal phosphate-dependent decarboxylase family protein [Candidatus Limnocylindrales bacterium]
MPVRATQDVESLRAALCGPLPEEGQEPLEVIEALAADAAPGLVASAGPRYFGFVIGGGVPAAVAADWLTSAWDQNAGLYVAGPAASVVEEAVGAWLLELFGLPPGSGYGFVTGCQMAHFTCLAAARHRVLARVGWDVEAAGLIGAPPIEVIIGGEAHATIHAALQFLGLGRERVHVVPADGQGRMRSEAFAEVLAAIPTDHPLIVCVQAGNVNTGAFDPIAEIIDQARTRAGVWVHVDGAFGLWARLSPTTAGLLEGVERADSWASDGHKWLNVPYDSGLAFVADPLAHAAAMSPPNAPYLQYGSDRRDQEHWVPEFSRRARGFPLYAAIRSLGRSGIREMVERGCEVARDIAAELGALPGVTILNEVVLNQVLVRFGLPDDPAGSDELTRAVVREIQDEGTIWLSGTIWHGQAAIRISVSNWATGLDEAEIAVAAIRRAADRAREQQAGSTGR